MVQIVAHRGSSGNRPENTLPAFAEAVRVKADIIELDVHLSKDGGLIVMHDETVDRTTNGKGRICDLTVAELKELNAGSWFSEEFQAAKVPTLKEVLDLLAAKNYRGILTIELKTDHYEYEGIEAKVSDLMNSQEWPLLIGIVPSISRPWIGSMRSNRMRPLILLWDAGKTNHRWRSADRISKEFILPIAGSKRQQQS